MTRARHVHDSGGVYRMTDAKYRKYIADGTHAPVDPAEYGKCITVVDFNATRAGRTDFADERANLGLIDLVDKRERAAPIF